MAHNTQYSLAAMLLAAACTSALAQDAGSLPEQPNDIEYATPEIAAKALAEKPGVVMRTQNGWIVAEDPSNNTFWSFPPPADFASPAVVRRQFRVEGNQVMVKMDVLCGGTKPGCDRLVLGFERLNQQMRNHLP